MLPWLLPRMVFNPPHYKLQRESTPVSRSGERPPADSFSPSQYGKLGPAILAVPFVIAPVFVSKLRAKVTTPERTEDRPVEDTLMVVPRENGKVISTVSALTSCLYMGVPSPPAVYFAPVDDPVPDTLDRSMIRMTAGATWNRLVSSTSSLEICA